MQKFTSKGGLIIALFILVVAGGALYMKSSAQTAQQPESTQQEQAAAPIDTPTSASSGSALDADGDEYATPQTGSEQSAPKSQPSRESQPISAPTPAGATVYRISGSTRASFIIDEVLRGSPFTVVGSTPDVTGSIDLDKTNPEKSTISTIRINAQTLKTDDPKRDGAIKFLILHSNDSANQYITFEPKTISGLPKALSSTPLTITLQGDLTISGITKQEAFTAKNVIISDTGITGTATAKILRSDFKLTIPNIPFVASVPDEFSLSIDLSAVPGT